MLGFLVNLEIYDSMGFRRSRAGHDPITCDLWPCLSLRVRMLDAKSSDVWSKFHKLPVLSFALLASPAAAISTFAFEKMDGFLEHSRAITLARGLQLEKTNRVANIQFIEVALSQFLGMGSSRIIPSFGRLVGCIIILISACCTMYIGPEKEIE
uniref:Uncharacterized protein n=1 Tax=Solanum lycopersicum TaxID=4081 RepID=A0A3Q7GH02_SOLLC